MSALGTSSVQEARELLELSWLECRGIGGRALPALHFVVPADAGLWAGILDEEGQLASFLAACGRPLTSGHIPGIGARMDAPRCSQCCRAVGMPRGVGSPKNSKECRPVVEGRLRGARPVVTIGATP